MSRPRAMPPESEPDDDFELAGPKAQRRPLQQGETVPQIPTMVEQLDMVWKAANRSSSKSKPR